MAATGDRRGGTSGGKAVRVAVLGDKQVGKTSLIARFLHGSFSPHYLYTVGCDLEKLDVTINAEKVHVTLVDAAGQQYVRSLIKSLYRDVHGILVVFDVTREPTLHSLQQWLAQIELVNPSGPIIFLVGNKQDLTSHRNVPREEARLLSNRLELPYFETSAKTGHNVRETFLALVRASWQNITQPCRPLSSDTVKITEDSRDSNKELSSCCSTSRS